MTNASKCTYMLSGAITQKNQRNRYTNSINDTNPYGRQVGRILVIYPPRLQKSFGLLPSDPWPVPAKMANGFNGQRLWLWRDYSMGKYVER